jgi:dihydrofolate synthase/folylpolyglutamate synthase
MTYAEAIQFLYSLRWFGTKLGLSNTFKLAELAGNPHHQLRFIHVAGTNGKGSTCAMLESIFRAAGLRVGLFTSPHLVTFGERIQVNRQLISESDIIRLVEQMLPLLERGWGPIHPSTNPSIHSPPITPVSAHPTFFEVVTVMALRYFAEQKCDLVVWETGLGGRLDATNIVTPLASVITNIQFDHQKWLGETLASIAAEKAGIIKSGVPVVTATDEPEALKVIHETARAQNASLTIIHSDIRSSPSPHPMGRGIKGEGDNDMPRSDAHEMLLNEINLPLMGTHQRLNANLAIATVHALASLIPVTNQSIRTGLSHVNWPGRLQLITRPSGQKILLDGAHNIAGAQTLADSLSEYFPGVKPTLILGILQDKDWEAICHILAPLASGILLAPVPSERTANPAELAATCQRANPAISVQPYPSLRAALSGTSSDPFILITGSLYLVGEALELLQLSEKKNHDERGLNEWDASGKSAAISGLKR